MKAAVAFLVGVVAGAVGGVALVHRLLGGRGVAEIHFGAPGPDRLPVEGITWPAGVRW